MTPARQRVKELEKLLKRDTDDVFGVFYDDTADAIRVSTGQTLTRAEFDTLYPDGTLVHFAWREHFPDELSNVKDAKELAALIKAHRETHESEDGVLAERSNPRITTIHL